MIHRCLYMAPFGPDLCLDDGGKQYHASIMLQRAQGKEDIQGRVWQKTLDFLNGRPKDEYSDLLLALHQVTFVNTQPSQ